MSAITNAAKPDLSAALTELLAAELAKRPFCTHLDGCGVDLVSGRMLGAVVGATTWPENAAERVVRDSMLADPAATLRAAEDIALTHLKTLRTCDA